MPETLKTIIEVDRERGREPPDLRTPIIGH
jgi:hypothetical protein